jgi:hypothetical protein
MKVTPSLTSKIISTLTGFMKTKRSTHVKEKRILNWGRRRAYNLARHKIFQ